MLPHFGSGRNYILPNRAWLAGRGARKEPPGAAMLTFGVKQNLASRLLPCGRPNFATHFHTRGCRFGVSAGFSCSLSLITPTVLNQQPGQKMKDGNWIFLNPAMGGHLDL